MLAEVTERMNTLGWGVPTPKLVYEDNGGGVITIHVNATPEESADTQGG